MKANDVFGIARLVIYRRERAVLLEPSGKGIILWTLHYGEEVREAFKSKGVVVLVGDWTDGDPAITRFLESKGRAGVPLYLWYAPGREAEELPQVLTPAMLIARARQPR